MELDIGISFLNVGVDTLYTDSPVKYSLAQQGQSVTFIAVDGNAVGFFATRCEQPETRAVFHQGK